MGTGAAVNFVLMFAERPDDEMTMSAFPFASLVWESLSRTETTAKPSDCKRLLTKLSEAVGVPVSKSALGAALSTMKLQSLVRETAGEPLSAKISVTKLLESRAKSPGGL